MNLTINTLIAKRHRFAFVTGFYTCFATFYWISNDCNWFYIAHMLNGFAFYIFLDIISRIEEKSRINKNDEEKN